MSTVITHFRAVPSALAAVVMAGTLTGCLSISRQQEADMGLNYAQQINAQLPIVRDPEVNAYITRLGDSLAVLVDDEGRNWRFSIVDDPEINAFAVPGGYIYVNRGLIMRAQTLSQLAGVVGHEIAHVTRRHSVKQMEKGRKVGIGATAVCLLQPSFCQAGGGDLLNVAGGAVMAKFSRGDETEADREGLRYIMRAGIDPRGLPEMFEIMLAESRAKGRDGGGGFLASHPAEADRIAATRAMIAALPAGSLDGLTRDTPGFQRFKARLASLPQTPKPGR
jgi:beta-barrel assembly-enhancing protease